MRGVAATAGTPAASSILDTIHFQNSGIVASIPLPIGVTIAATLAILAIIIFGWAVALKRGRSLAVVALGLIAGGAISNLVDRAQFGYVFDWILVFGRSAVNVADICIVSGAVLFLIESGHPVKASDSDARGMMDH